MDSPEAGREVWTVSWKMELNSMVLTRMDSVHGVGNGCRNAMADQKPRSECSFLLGFLLCLYSSHPMTCLEYERLDGDICRS